jgi:hypothetical protein
MKTGGPWVQRLPIASLITRALVPYALSGVLLGGTVALLVLHACGCSTPSVLTPATGPGTDYPCGVSGRVCQNKMCCGEYDVCGGDDPSCPVGSCCFFGEPPEFMTRDGGALQRVRPQRRP